ncbi:hypothetical protein [Antrihabitans spumae]|uniref:Uncharacterized protein n=1 Tax=Antrihabitans spumae TaxID=3373370 RepID=A0ABW7KKP1_9NOCA
MPTLSQYLERAVREWQTNDVEPLLATAKDDDERKLMGKEVVTQIMEAMQYDWMHARGLMK